MYASLTVRRLSVGLLVGMTVGTVPAPMWAQTGKWVGTITQLSNGGGTAEVAVDPRNEKQSRVKLTFHNTRRDMRLAWDIVVGKCGDNGPPIAPQPAFTLVQTQMDGSGSVTANVPKLESGKSYYVRVFNPQTAPTDAAAFGCANLSEKP